MKKNNSNKNSFYKTWWFGAFVTLAIVSIIASIVYVEMVGDSNRTIKTETQVTSKDDEVSYSSTNYSQNDDDDETDEFKFIQLIRETPKSNMLAALKGEAEEKWGTNFEMVQYEYEIQVEAYEQAMDIINNPTLPGTIDEIILEDSLNIWGLNFEMVMYEYEIQIEAYEEMYD